jgi:hypothetical protein
MITPALRWKLVLPLLLPVSVVLVTHIVEVTGHRWNVHGDFLGVIAAFFLLLFLGLIIEIAALVKALPMLVNNPEARTPLNVLCVGLGLAFALFCLAGVLFVVL